ncbi:MAG: hypothetical protein A2Y12_00820 [Planctomycetes bacterium GWF2_42_9]|nr:MAG: hypothetical protein A2Y12_00820 [Planctomycetes bacterium GWF2_42_9]HAL44477.1 hypothetical protein [Phycisphaerales bacterium]
MCHYLTTVLPEKIDIGNNKGFLNEFQLSFEPIKNQHVIKQLKAGEQYLRTTNYDCDCGTAIGVLAARKTDKDIDLNQKEKIKSFKKEGWSETKINRWLQQQKLNEEKKDKEAIRYSEEAENWIEFFKAALINHKIPYIGLLLHWYETNIETERIEIKKREVIRFNELNIDRILKMNENILYEIR